MALLSTSESGLPTVSPRPALVLGKGSDGGRSRPWRQFGWVVCGALRAQRAAPAVAVWGLAAWQGTARASVGEIGHFWPRHWLPWPQTESQGAGTESEEGNGDATWYLGEEPEKHDFISGSQFYPLVRKHGLKLQQHLSIFYANCWRTIVESINILLPFITHLAPF